MGKNFYWRAIFESEGEIRMISNLLDLLKNNPKLHAWNFRVVSTDSYQLFFIKRQLDMNREVVVDEYIINIFTKEVINRKELIGHATFSIYPTMSLEEVNEKIEEQIALCKYTLSPTYKLPKKANIKPIIKEKLFEKHTLKEAAFVAADALFEEDNFDKGYINSSEIFVNYVETKYFDSNDNVFVYASTYGQIEFVITWKDKGDVNEVEVYKFIEFDSLDNKYIQSQAHKAFLEAGSRISAIKTPQIQGIKLLLTGEYVKKYFLHFVEKIKADNIYNNLSDYKISDTIFSGKDKLTIRLEPTMKHSTKGAPFDKEGTALKKVVVIDKGVIKNIWGSNAYSQYLNKTPNGLYENIVVSSGTLTEEQLEGEDYLEILELSDFEIDTVTGSFGSEIRLAYLYRNKEKIVVTGGSISGNVYTSMDDAIFSNETEQINNYLGPKKVLLSNINFNKG